MTDSVRCNTDSPNSFTCEVQLDANETLTCEAPEPEPASAPPPPPPPSPAVSSLVSSFTSRTVVRAPPAPLLDVAALLKCASSELSMALALTSGKSPLISALTMLKASLDTSTCLTLARNEAAQRNAEAYCVGQGGVVVGVEGDKTICEVREQAK